MKKFIIQTLSFSIIALSAIISIILQADGKTDGFYLKFTTPKQHNLILGTSKAAQSIQPQVFSKTMGIYIYNYAFTLSHSPYGPVYLNNIKKKLTPNTTDGLFIVTIDPWSISSICSNPNDLTTFRENGLCLANTSSVDTKPNLEYLYKNLAGNYSNLLFNSKSPTFLHENGWLEVSIDMDSLVVSTRTKAKVKAYTEDMLPVYKYSSLRVNYLEQTIAFLKKHGEVYIVRLPISEKIMEIENKLMPDFYLKIERAINLSDGYFDMTPLNSKYTYIDGNHLYKESGKLVTTEIANWIQVFRNDKK